MTSTARLLKQRSVGDIQFRVERDGVAVLREAGSSKLRVPRGSHEAILINTSGGLAGGDRISISAELGDGASLVMTSQAAERVYRTLGPPAVVDVALKVGRKAELLWLPQESIFFEGSALERRLNVSLAEEARFLAVETMVFGRREMGEVISKVSVLDQWNIRRAEKLIHAEAFRLGPQWPRSKATFGDNHACATLLMIAPDAEQKLDGLRAVLGPEDGASFWNGKLVARLLARDSFHLRKTLIQVVSVCAGCHALPKTWTF